LKAKLDGCKATGDGAEATVGGGAPPTQDPAAIPRLGSGRCRSLRYAAGVAQRRECQRPERSLARG